MCEPICCLAHAALPTAVSSGRAWKGEGLRQGGGAGEGVEKHLITWDRTLHLFAGMKRKKKGFFKKSYTTQELEESSVFSCATKLLLPSTVRAQKHSSNHKITAA